MEVIKIKKEQILKQRNYDVAELGIGDIVPMVIAVVIVGVVLTFGLTMQTDLKDDINATAHPEAAAAATKAIEANAKWGNKLPLIVGVMIMGVIIGLIVRYLAFK